jgi:glycosyltransferase 2 family protein
MVALTGAGMGQEAAFASVITYRLSTFYLPPTWGWFALQWLRRHSYL